MPVSDIQPDKAFQYFSKSEIDSMALKVIQRFRETSNKKNFTFDIDRLVDWLNLGMLVENMDEPDGASFFAGCLPDNGGTICLNQKYCDLFDERIDIYKNCVGHEIGHIFLKHLDEYSNELNPSLFEGFQKPPIFLHKSSWYQYGLSSDEIKQRIKKTEDLKQRWTQLALVNCKARDALKEITNKFEPKWMFYQAEHFSLCLAVPQDELFELMETIPLVAGWRPLYQYRDAFQVSITAIKVRLHKLDLIDFDEKGIPFPKTNSNQNTLF